MKFSGGVLMHDLGMKIELRLSEQELQEAVAEYAEKRNYKVLSKDVRIVYHRGDEGDPRGSGSAHYAVAPAELVPLDQRR